MIEVDFHGHKKVIEKSRLYMHSLNEDQSHQDRNKLQAELIYEMSIVVGCEISESEILKQAYVQVYHAEFEKTMIGTYTRLVELLDNKRFLSIETVMAKEHQDK